LARRQLIQQGCRSIASNFGETTHPEAVQRHQGYLRALNEAKHVQDPRLAQYFMFGEKRIRATA